MSPSFCIVILSHASLIQSMRGMRANTHYAGMVHPGHYRQCNDMKLIQEQVLVDRKWLKKSSGIHFSSTEMQKRMKKLNTEYHEKKMHLFIIHSTLAN